MIKTQSLIEMSLGVAIGAITFAGSVIAFAKLNGNMRGAPIILPARHLLNLVIVLAIVGADRLFRDGAAKPGPSGRSPAWPSSSASP